MVQRPGHWQNKPDVPNIRTWLGMEWLRCSTSEMAQQDTISYDLSLCEKPDRFSPKSNNAQHTLLRLYCRRRHGCGEFPHGFGVRQVLTRPRRVAAATRRPVKNMTTTTRMLARNALGAERRQYRRVAYKAPVVAELTPRGLSRCPMLAEDISKRGLRVSCTHYVPARTQLLVTFYGHGPKEVVREVGTVVWVQQIDRQTRWRLGLAFDELPPGNRTPRSSAPTPDCSANSRVTSS